MKDYINGQMQYDWDFENIQDGDCTLLENGYLEQCAVENAERAADEAESEARRAEYHRIRSLENKHGLDIDCDALDAHPELIDCASARQASKVLFGVQTLTAHISLGYTYVQEIRAFFGDNHSDMIAWFGAFDGKIGWQRSMQAKPEHRNVYKAMVKSLGLARTVGFTLSRDFADIAKGFEFAKASKKRWAAFERDIVAAMHLFPAAAHATMVHDYFVRQMQNAERIVKPKGPAKEVEITLPMMPCAETIGDYQILVPRNEADLRRIGRAQNHCVGTEGMGYADKIKSGRSVIVAIYSKRLKDGLCVEFGQTGYVIQAQGQHRRSPTLKEETVIGTLSAMVKARNQSAA